MAGAPEGKTYAWRLCGWGARPGLDPPSPLSESQKQSNGVTLTINGGVQMDATW